MSRQVLVQPFVRAVAMDQCTGILSGTVMNHFTTQAAQCPQLRYLHRQLTGRIIKPDIQILAVCIRDKAFQIRNGFIVIRIVDERVNIFLMMHIDHIGSHFQGGRDIIGTYIAVGMVETFFRQFRQVKRFHRSYQHIEIIMKDIAFLHRTFTAVSCHQDCAVFIGLNVDTALIGISPRSRQVQLT